jgi:hypothetical protein
MPFLPPKCCNERVFQGVWGCVIDFVLINEEIFLHECIFDYDPLQLNHPMEGVIYFLGLQSEQLNLLL